MATRREKEQREVRYADAKERAEKHDKGFEPTALNVPKDAKLFRFKKKGLFRLDFLPYVAGKGNPFADEGFLAYERTYYTHWIPTSTGNSMYVCLARTYSAKCPVCAFIARALREGTIDQKTAKDMEVKERQLFNVIDLDNSKEGVQLFEFNWWQLGKLIDSRVDKKEKYRNFFHLKGGHTIEIEVEEGSYNGKTKYQPIGIAFEPRDNYDDDILDQVHNLDEIPKRLTYEELEKILLEGGEDSKEKDAPAPSKNGSTKARGSDNEDDELEDEEDADDNENDDPTAEDLGIEKGSKVTYRKKEWDVVKVSSDGTSLTLEDDEGEQERGVAPGDVKLLKVEVEDDDELEEDEDEDPTPARGAGSAKSLGTAGVKKRSLDEDEDEDELNEDNELEEDEDEEEEPAPKKKKRAS